MFCVKFKLSADHIQVLEFITGVGFTLRHWHKLFVEVYFMHILSLVTENNNYSGIRFLCRVSEGQKPTRA